ncbi:hypothetical protein BKA65DRAFT_518259 [Rhexocercosporidium sp. MPI-PUGE-AT-0058]|nr:hypothetical protein BKA65DRAFT_518259 [Rhexocercosporidium sp. MPI-PUGE-AT-0058]
MTGSGYGDDWSMVQDTAARRRIQNRIAQRAHSSLIYLSLNKLVRTFSRGLKYGRKSKAWRGDQTTPRDTAEGRSSIQPTCSHDRTNNAEDDTPAGITTLPSAIDSNPIDFHFLDSFYYQLTSIQGGSFADTLLSIGPNPGSRVDSDSQYPEPFTEQVDTTRQKLHIQSPLTDYLIVVRALGTLSALLLNASVLQIDCTEIRGRQIYIPPDISTSTTLTPTSFQTTTPHLPYVDLIPFSPIRNRLLESQNFINGVESWADVTRDVKSLQKCPVGQSRLGTW